MTENKRPNPNNSYFFQSIILFQFITLQLTLFSAILSETATARQVVHSYVTHIQSERERTRFTLTEWLRIKERMKMMDLWLALFSNPKQHNKFSPEFYFSYAQNEGLAISSTNSEGYQISGTTLDSQLWLTNLVSATTRMRTVNVDFGIGMQMQSSSLNGTIDIENATEAANQAVTQTNSSINSTSQNSSSSTSNPSALASIDRTNEAYSRRQSTSLNLRLFGRHIQDSSLVLGYGIYDAATYQNSIGNQGSEVSNHRGTNESVLEDKGNKMNASLQIYLNHWLGMEGNYKKYNGKVAAQNLKSNHTYYDYSGFLEISLLRVSSGVYTENRSYSDSNSEIESIQEAGVKTAIKLQF